VSGARAIRKLLIANRGEVARRIIRTCRRLGIATVAVYSEPDREAVFTREADEAVPIGGASPAESYLRREVLVEAALRAGADAVHPGYGFLAEDAAFARLCLDSGLIFVGPSPDAIAAMGSKLEAKRTAKVAGIPVLPTITLDGHDGLRTEAIDITYPVLVKASAGGGGRGMRLVETAGELGPALEAASREAQSAFGDGTVFVEPYLRSARHVEVQVFGDSHGRVVDLYERECSIQRRYQKVIEESPSPAVDDALRRQLGEAAVSLARAINYVGAGTIEFILGPAGDFHFLEMNTRLQVEHAVTEAVTGLDLVALQLEVAEGGRLPDERPLLRGHAIEARLYAEDPEHDWRPATGVLSRFEHEHGDGLRIDSAVLTGSVVSPHYDSMLAKVIAHGPSRERAAAHLAAALTGMRIHGLKTNRDLLVRILRHPEFLEGRLDTGFLERHPPEQLGAPLADEAAERLHCVAAALVGQHRRRQHSRVLTTLPSGWRNVPSEPQRETFEGRSGRIAVGYRFEAETIRVWLDDQEVTDIHLEAVDAASCDLVSDGIRRRYLVDRESDLVYVDSPLGSSELRQVNRLPEADRLQAPGSLAAPIPGIVVRVLVEAGQRVEAGQELVVLEAMKMEHRICAPDAGLVTEVSVAVGQTVAAGMPLVVLETHK